MQRKSLAQKIKEAQILLEANDERMAYHMRLTFNTFTRIKSGDITLKLNDRELVERNIERLLERCGLNY